MMGILWGLTGVFFIKILYPFLSRQIEKLPNRMGRILSVLIGILLLCDMGISGIALIREKNRHIGKPARNQIEQYLDQQYPDAYMKSIYTEMKFVK